ncbi:hypothetical protein BLNAU_3370 [Blattamonas nauphoetae]|uniref:Uncharacterized protein n=1 Tax=Blattamonas nauphoetae TaxID=2049346 RepID=A0ABQ9XLM6_9EUKA|nr:hypothetical protein BLNAU_23918 [Blattamonas nauphoetae]KAK2944559.1 hypothetical protein BLNAU_20513 [Blattamonas nauphoetae]KAK2945958.1 hypothetical protein BLNAU_19102 [Blattamonas nauphoetae]KAK2953323.1 hypothetical protein BLNAU_11786 [Blattamonas nauphoetae]KAK2961572.1 hypothetical protein BLNAU_3370 [Blattamonas nauphoetae]
MAETQDRTESSKRRTIQERVNTNTLTLPSSTPTQPLLLSRPSRSSATASSPLGTSQAQSDCYPLSSCVSASPASAFVWPLPSSWHRYFELSFSHPVRRRNRRERVDSCDRLECEFPNEERGGERWDEVSVSPND